jgi:hypothetical protein
VSSFITSFIYYFYSLLKFKYLKRVNYKYGILYHTTRNNKKIIPNISFSTWSINGLFNRVLGDKSKNKDFLDTIVKIDFIFLTETWTDSCCNIPGFETIASEMAKPATKHACRQSGGISLLFKSKFKNYVNIIKNTKNILWSKISKEILNSDLDLYVCGTYIPPEK